MGRSKSKKVLQIQKKNESNELRAEVLKELQKYSLKAEHVLLMQPTSPGIISKKNKLSAANYRESLGLPLLPEEVEEKKKINNKKLKSLEKEKNIEIIEKNYPTIQDTTDLKIENKEINYDSEYNKDKSYININPLNQSLEISPKPEENDSDKKKIKNIVNKRKIVYETIFVKRKPNIEKERLKLPSIMMKYDIIEAVKNNNIIIITGDTGSGKSTQVPQFLYEAGLATDIYKIAVTQPRRIAAISISNRVGDELNDMDLVGYQVRYDRSYYPNKCRIKFMTDGILMKEIQSDFLCTNYQVIILDEAHERSINSDILIGLLSRVVKLRQESFDLGTSPHPPLKLIIMSATLRLSDFLENPNLFSIQPPNIHIESKTHSVSNHFSKNTPQDYLQASKEKVLQIHKKLPAGSILVFVSGSREVHQLCNSLKFQKAKQVNTNENSLLLFDDSEQDNDYNDSLININDDIKELNSDFTNEDPSKIYSSKKEEETIQNTVLNYKKIEEFNDNEQNNDSMEFIENDVDLDFLKSKSSHTNWLGCDGSGNLNVLPLYASLPAEEQIKAFKNPKENERIVIISTNIAETSVTLPNIRYIVDTGKEKKRNYLRSSGVSYFSIQWISKASAEQRSGRCGRIGPGHCYRLYSSSVYENQFSTFSSINLLEAPLESTLLFISSLGISHIHKFPFPTPPSLDKILQASEKLFNLGAISFLYSKSIYFSLNKPIVCTKLGLNMSSIPVSPQFAKMLLVSASRPKSDIDSILKFTCILVAYLSIGNVFEYSKGFNSQEFLSQTVLKRNDFKSDLDLFLWFFGAYTHSDKKSEFCSKNNLNSKNMKEISLLTRQLFNIINNKLKKSSNYFTSPFILPSSEQHIFLHDCILEGLIDQIAVRIGDNKNDTNLPYNAYKTAQLKSGGFCFIHPASIAKNLRPLPQILAFNYIIQQNKNYMIDCFPVEPSILAKYDSPLIKKGNFLSLPAPRYLLESDKCLGFVAPVYTPLDYQLPTVELEIPKTDSLCYRVFAKSLIEGLIFKKLKNYKCFMTSETSTILIQPNIEQNKVIKALENSQCSSKSELSHIWMVTKNFLLSEYTQLLKLANYNQLLSLQEIWPPID